MTKRELRELIKSTLKEFTGTGDGGGGHMSMTNMPSQREGGSSFKTDEDEIEFYNKQNAGEIGNATRGMVPAYGNPNGQKQVRF